MCSVYDNAFNDELLKIAEEEKVEMYERRDDADGKSRIYGVDGKVFKYKAPKSVNPLVLEMPKVAAGNQFLQGELPASIVKAIAATGGAAVGVAGIKAYDKAKIEAKKEKYKQLMMAARAGRM